MRFLWRVCPLPLSAVMLMLALLVPALAALAAPATVAAAQETTCTIDGFADQALEIMAPAAPGGGWDTTAREMQRVLQEEGIVPTVEVYNVEGAGGTIGIAQLVNDERGNDHQLMMMGLVMVGAIATNASPVTLADVTPISRLTAEFEVIVVPAASEYQTLDDLIAAFQADPTAISWGGGSAGGTDHILVGLIAQEVGVDPTQVNYVPFSGGGEALAAILGGQVSAGVSGVGEWLDQIESGELRALAVSGTAAAADATPTTGGATPTAGVSVAPTSSWRTGAAWSPRPRFRKKAASASSPSSTRWSPPQAGRRPVTATAGRTTPSRATNSPPSWRRSASASSAS
jgi:putative tricarboxylic transport membrane protein